MDRYPQVEIELVADTALNLATVAKRLSRRDQTDAAPGIDPQPDWHPMGCGGALVQHRLGRWPSWRSDHHLLEESRPHQRCEPRSAGQRPLNCVNSVSAITGCCATVSALAPAAGLVRRSWAGRAVFWHRPAPAEPGGGGRGRGVALVDEVVGVCRQVLERMRGSGWQRMYSSTGTNAPLWERPAGRTAPWHRRVRANPAAA